MSMDDLQAAVGLWHRGAFPHEHPLELALCSAEELGELAEALDDAAAAKELTRKVTSLTRAFLKESHGANDRRADVDWSAKVYDEIGDVLIVLAAVADRRGWSLEQCLRARLTFVSERFPAQIRKVNPHGECFEASDCRMRGECLAAEACLLAGDDPS